MNKLFIYTKDENNNISKKTINYKRPRDYMCGYTFSQMVEYAKSEFEWNEIEEKNIVAFSIENKKQHWQKYIAR